MYASLRINSHMKSSDFVCEGTSDPSVCVGLPLYKNWQSHRLCVLHFPGKKSLKLFQDCADAKLDRNDFNFDGVWFPEELVLELEDREFASEVIFSNCTFNGRVSFGNCLFHQKAKFSNTELKGGSTSSVVNFVRRQIFQNPLLRITQNFQLLNLSHL